MENSVHEADVCRICRLKDRQEQPLFHPCICSGSIKYVHLECLEQWIRYSRKEFCELCRYQFIFKPVYAPDMPQQLAIKDIVAVIISSVLTRLKLFLHLSFAGLAWLCVLPYAAYWIFLTLFDGLFDAKMSSSIDMWSLKSIFEDIFCGYIVITCTLSAFVVLVWIRHQILFDGDPDWLVINEPNNQPPLPLNVLLLRVREGNPIGEVDQEAHLEIGIQADMGHWNWADGEDFRWERFFGLDGSLGFLANVFCAITMYGLFVLLFAFLPYQLGNLMINAVSLQDIVASSHFKGSVTTMCGYCLILMVLQIMYTYATVVRFKRFIGISYMIVKVSLLLVICLIVSPLSCGWWLDICSYSMFDTSFKDRLASFHSAPFTSMTIHWLVGLVYLYCLSSLFMVLIEVVRPDVLWFKLDSNEINFLQELGQEDMLQHGKRIIKRVLEYGIAIFLAIWLPIRILKFIWPSLLPYTIAFYSKSTKQLCLELFFLQLVAIALIDRTLTRNWLKISVRFWCVIVSHLLGIKSYLMGDREEPPLAVAPIHQLPAASKEVHDKFNRKYTRPTNFTIRFIVLLVLAALSVVLISLSVMILPVWLGLLATFFWSALTVVIPALSQSLSPFIHVLINVVCGIYFWWISLRTVCIIGGWLQNRRVFVLLKLWLEICSKIMVAFIVFVGIIPFLFGVLLQLAIVVPLQVPLHQTPILWTWQDWYLGFEYMQIVCSIIIVGPNGPLKRAIVDIFRDGFLQLNLILITQRLIKPMIAILSLSLAVPYVIAHSIVPLIIEDNSLKLLIAGRIYPTLILMIIIIKCMIRQNRLERLYEHVKNDKYLLGRTLENYNHTNSISGQN